MIENKRAERAKALRYKKPIATNQNLRIQTGMGSANKNQLPAVAGGHRMTNREKLRQMSDEELGKWLCDHRDCAFCLASNDCRIGETGFIKWLKEESEEE